MLRRTVSWSLLLLVFAVPSQTKAEGGVGALPHIASDPKEKPARTELAKSKYKHEGIFSVVRTPKCHCKLDAASPAASAECILVDATGNNIASSLPDRQLEGDIYRYSCDFPCRKMMREQKPICGLLVEDAPPLSARIEKPFEYSGNRLPSCTDPKLEELIKKCGHGYLDGYDGRDTNTFFCKCGQGRPVAEGYTCQVVRSNTGQGVFEIVSSPPPPAAPWDKKGEIACGSLKLAKVCDSAAWETCWDKDSGKELMIGEKQKLSLGCGCVSTK